MWIFTQQGMVSLAEHPTDASMIVAQSPSLEALLYLFPTVSPHKAKEPGYAFSATIPRPLAVDAMYAAVEAINYPRLRDSLADPRYRDHCLNIWAEVCEQALEEETDLEALSRICAEIDARETGFPATPS